MFFSVITKNLNWEILTKNLVTFKGWMGLRCLVCDYFDIQELFFTYYGYLIIYFLDSLA